MMAKRPKKISPKFVRFDIVDSNNETDLLIDVLVAALEKESNNKEPYTIGEALLFIAKARLDGVMENVVQHFKCGFEEILELENNISPQITTDCVIMLHKTIRPRMVPSGPAYIARVAKAAVMIGFMPGEAFQAMGMYITARRAEMAKLPKQLPPPRKPPPPSDKPSDIA